MLILFLKFFLGCGGLLTHPSGSISTPNYPKGYGEGIQCDWLMQLDSGTSIEITFVDVDFEPSVNCEYDYITVKILYFLFVPTIKLF